MKLRLPLLTVYRSVTRALTPAARFFLHWRLRQGKEDASRLGERKGIAVIARPKGRLAWLHGASVGEGLALLPIVEQLIERKYHVLVTTGTMTSASILESRLPPGALHQFVPIDIPRYMKRFVDHWQPDIVMIAESELWPNLITAVSSRKIPLMLVNARLSQRSFLRWQKLPGFISALLERIDLVLAQTQNDAARLLALGARRVKVTGNLKYEVDPPPAERELVSAFSSQIGARPVWVAASTHEGEEEIAARVHLRLLQRFPSLLTIVVPRHVQRAGSIRDMAAKLSLVSLMRSSGKPIDRTTQFYIADTMGEMGLFYRISSLIFMGKSLSGSGGQNPVEAAKLGCAILHGPNTGNFTEIYAAMDAARGGLLVEDEEKLAVAVNALLANSGQLRKMARAAGDHVDQLGGASTRIMQAIDPYFVQIMIAEQQ